MPSSPRHALALVLALAPACGGGKDQPTSGVTLDTFHSSVPPQDDGGGDGEDATASATDAAGITGTGEPSPTTGEPPPPGSTSGPVDETTTTADPSTSEGPTSDPSTTRGPTTDPGPVCGDGQADPGEDCDGADFKGIHCTDLGFSGGTLVCTGDCWVDVSQCTTSQCQNGVIEGDEVCDCGGDTCTAAELGQTACADLETPDGDGELYYGGKLACSADCKQLDESACEYCGDKKINGEEECDGSNLQGWTCKDLGWGGGTLKCYPDCSSFDEDACFG